MSPKPIASPRPRRPSWSLTADAFSPNPEVGWYREEIARHEKQLVDRRNSGGCGIGCLGFVLFVVVASSLVPRLGEGAANTLGAVFSAGVALFLFKRHLRSTDPNASSDLASLRAGLAEAEQAERDARDAWDSAREERRRKLLSAVHYIGSGALETAGVGESLVAQMKQLRVASSTPPDQPSSIVLRQGERPIVEYLVTISGYRDTGYDLNAGMQGSFGGSSVGGGLSGRHTDVQVGGFGGSVRGTISGSMERREAHQVLDRGRLMITDLRIVFVGSRRTDELLLSDVISATGSPATLDLKWAQKRDGERFNLIDGDLVARLIMALCQRAPGSALTLSDAGSARLPSPQPDTAHTHPGPETARVERDCPWCAEPILARARVCKHCGRDVEPT